MSPISKNDARRTLNRGKFVIRIEGSASERAWFAEGDSFYGTHIPDLHRPFPPFPTSARPLPAKIWRSVLTKPRACPYGGTLTRSLIQQGIPRMVMKLYLASDFSCLQGTSCLCTSAAMALWATEGRVAGITTKTGTDVHTTKIWYYKPAKWGS